MLCISLALPSNYNSNNLKNDNALTDNIKGNKSMLLSSTDSKRPYQRHTTIMYCLNKQLGSSHETIKCCQIQQHSLTHTSSDYLYFYSSGSPKLYSLTNVQLKVHRLIHCQEAFLNVPS